MKDHRVLEFSQPTNQTGLMIFVLVAVSFVAYLLFPAVAPIFLASPYLNGFRPASIQGWMAAPTLGFL